MNRETALYTIVQSMSQQDIIVSTTGLISREMFERYDDERGLYIPGSMGLVSSVGLGIALNCSNRVTVIDGDSSLLMNLGTLVTIGHHAPSNLTHIVIDNESYASCSEETSMSQTVNFIMMAKAVGYKFAVKVHSKKQLSNVLSETNGKLSFILAKIELGGRRDFKRPLNLPSIKERIKSFIGGNENGI